MSNCYLFAEGDSITTRPPTATLKYVCDGYDTDSEARIAVASTAPGTKTVNNTTLSRGNITVERYGRADNCWMATVSYGVLRPAFQFDTTGTTFRMTQSYGTSAYGVNARNYLNGINYNEGSGGFDGVDVTIPSLGWTETYTIPVANLTTSYVATIASVTGCVNNAPFRGFAAGEVLFLGASGGNQKDDSDADIQFRFAASPNVTGLTVAGISGIAKGGWQYLWVAYKPGIDANNNKVPKAIGAYVETVYRPGNFGALGI